MSVQRARMLASHAEIEAHDQRTWIAAYDVLDLASLAPRTRSRVAGVLRSVTYAPAGSSTSLRAELFDGTASIDLVWTGRRDVPGIVPGRRLIASGMVARHGDGRPRLAIHNPRYELLPTSRSADAA